MKPLSQLVLETQNYFTSIINTELNSIDDREEQDMALDNLKLDCEFISTELQEQPDAYDAVFSFSKFLKNHNQDSMAKELEIGLAHTTPILKSKDF
mgnify:CR=1 FL=1